MKRAGARPAPSGLTFRRRQLSQLSQLSQLALALSLAAVWGSAAQAQGLRLTPSFSVSQVLTDNRNLSASDAQAESITVLSPGFRLSRNSPQLQALVDYSLNASIYGRGSSANSIANALTATANAVLIEQHLFLASSASISQQSISALALQGNRPNNINANNTELRTFTLAPSLRGRLFGEVAFDASLTSSISSSANAEAGDAINNNAALRVGDSSRVLGWSFDASRSIADFAAGRRTTQDRLGFTLTYSPLPALRFLARAGQERSNLEATDARSSNSWGAGVTWQPTPRTQLNLQADRRFFGDGYSVTASHRLRRAVFVYTASRNTTETTSGAGLTLSVYDLFFAQFASTEPDPVLRDILVRNFLAASGLNPLDRLTGGFLSTAVSLQRLQNLSMSWQGTRMTAVVSAFASSTERLDGVSQGQDDLSRAGVLRQSGLNVSMSRRISPRSSLVFSMSHQRTAGGDTVRGNTVNEGSLSWSGRVTPKISLNATARHAQAKGANPYQENSLRAAINLSF